MNCTKPPILIVTLALFTACADRSAPDAKPTPARDAAGGTFAGTPDALRAHCEELAGRPEHDAPRVKVQHLLISFKDQGVPDVHRTREEAERLTADLYRQTLDGADFDALVKEHTNDSHPGMYEMTTTSRRRMVPAFGNIAWKLPVGGVGVACFDPQDSPYGWHIIKRLE